MGWGQRIGAIAGVKGGILFQLLMGGVGPDPDPGVLQIDLNCEVVIGGPVGRIDPFLGHFQLSAIEGFGGNQDQSFSGHGETEAINHLPDAMKCRYIGPWSCVGSVFCLEPGQQHMQTELIEEKVFATSRCSQGLASLPVIGL